jgi:hypothetical protein
MSRQDHEKAEKRKATIKEFEYILLRSKANALSTISQERPLNDREYDEYKDVMNKLSEASIMSYCELCHNETYSTDCLCCDDNKKDCPHKPPTTRYHIIIEGTDEEQMQHLFEEIQNDRELYDNCVLEEVTDEESIISDEDRCKETGGIKCTRPEQSPNEPPDITDNTKDNNESPYGQGFIDKKDPSYNGEE